ncbi:MAG: oxygenase MpaB family protein [Polyangiales bacterium]
MNDHSSHPVDLREFNASLQRVYDTTPKTQTGIQGPGSISWKIGKEWMLFAGGGAASLLQLAHPYVAYGVDEHSATRTDPIGRFNRTFQNVHAMLFGDLGKAMDSARRVRRLHDQVIGTIEHDVGRFKKGDAYDAADAGALLWVHATLIHGAVTVYELAIGPLSLAEKDQYWEESKNFARLFGVPDEIIPPNWTEFLKYWDEMINSDTIAVSKPAREIARFLLAQGLSRPTPATYLLQVLTAGLLPERLRKEYNLSFNARDRVVFHSFWKVVRPVYSNLPERLRVLPAYVEAMNRVHGNERPDRVGRAVMQFMLKNITPG